MNDILRSRLVQTLVWFSATLILWLLHTNHLSSHVAWALTIAAGITALANAGLLLIFRGRPLRIAAHLTVLGGLLASLYGHDE